MIKQRLLRQFPNPRGPLGWVAGVIMRRRTINVERTLATIEFLDLGPTDRVLELGHGPGVGLEAVLVKAGQAVGIEQSSVMSRMAARRNRRAIADGRLRLLVADAQRPPDDAGEFAAIFSSNVWQFWSDQVATLAAWRDHLGSGGVMAVTYRPPMADASRADALAAGDVIVEQLRDAGYGDVRLELIPFGDVPAVCALGVAP